MCADVTVGLGSGSVKSIDICFQEALSLHLALRGV